MRRQILEEVLDVKGDPILLGSMIAYAVKTDKDESHDEPRRLVIRLAVVIGSHYGNTPVYTSDGLRDQLLLNIRRLDGRRSGQMKPVLGPEGKWVFDRVVVLSSDSEKLWRKRCADIISSYINKVPGKDERIDEILKDIRNDVLGADRMVLNRPNTRKVEVDRKEEKYNREFGVRFSKDTRYQKDKRKGLDPTLTRQDKYNGRLVCPKCEWPLEEEGVDEDGNSGVYRYRCMRPGCDYVEIVKGESK